MRPALRSLSTIIGSAGGGRIDLRRFRLRLRKDGSGEVYNFILLLEYISSLQHRIDILWSLRLSRDLVIQPFLDSRTLLDNGLFLLLVDVCVLLLRGRSLRHVVVDSLAQLTDHPWSAFVLTVTRGDGVAKDFQSIEAGDVSGFGGVFAFVGVEPVFCLLESDDKVLLLGWLDVRGIAIIQLATGVINVLLQSILTILDRKRGDVSDCVC